MTSKIVLVVGLALACASANADIVSYDQMTGEPSTAWVLPSGGGSPASTGNRYLGVPITLAAGATTVTGFDTTMINNTGAALTFQPGWQVSLNYWIWNTWTPATTAVPVFSSLAGSGSVPFTFNAAQTIGANSFLFFTNLASPGPGMVPPSGVLPGVAIAPVTTAPTANTIGVVLNWRINRQDGLGFVELGGLSQVLVGGVTALPVSVGTNDFSAPNRGYYRSASAEANGNFLGTSSRQVGANSGMLMRVYTIPTPGAVALLGLGGLAVARRRAR